MNSENVSISNTYDQFSGCLGLKFAPLDQPALSVRAPLQEGELSNTALLSALPGESDLANNTDSETTLVRSSGVANLTWSTDCGALVGLHGGKV